MGRDWEYCPVCRKMIDTDSVGCEHYDAYFDYIYPDEEEEEPEHIDFWEYCEKLYNVKSDFTDEEFEILSQNTGRMFSITFKEHCPSFNCSFWVDLDAVLQEYRQK